MVRGFKIEMLLRLLTALTITAVIVMVLYLQNSWLFALVILLVCLSGYYEWISNRFKYPLYGFLLIFNFGFWSIFLIFRGAGGDELMAYFLYGAIIFSTALFDTFAFIIGSNFGKTYIVKNISPNKTLEGLIGGLLPLILIGIFLIEYQSKLSGVLGTKDYWIILYFVLIGLFAFIGDLLISYFKRQSGIKDTGTILPGHGGVLDRIDSHLIATPLLIILFFIFL